MDEKDLSPEQQIIYMEFQQRDHIIALLQKISDSLGKIEAFFVAKQEESEGPKYLGTQWNKESVE